MNDKNFMEELKQKREEYGVSQTRLAVACGISRDHYNRIETLQAHWKGKIAINRRTQGNNDKTGWAFQSARAVVSVDWLGTVDSFCTI